MCVPVPSQNLDLQRHMSWYYVQWFEVKGDCLVGWYWWNIWPSLFISPIHNYCCKTWLHGYWTLSISIKVSTCTMWIQSDGIILLHSSFQSCLENKRNLIIKISIQFTSISFERVQFNIFRRIVLFVIRSISTDDSDCSGQL